ncbi:MAG: lysozyme [Fluviibacter phosphoraccumulans]
MTNRVLLASLTLSASALVGLVVHEGWAERAMQPVPGDKWTVGFGTTDGVKPGDSITPPKALVRALADVQKFEGAIKECVGAPLFQHEYDAYVSLSYNIGTTAFCSSTLVRKLNAEDYEGACREILRWDKFKGKPLKGLTIRRQAEFKQCMGES